MRNPILIVAGTRPEAIKLSPVLKGLGKHELDRIFVWSGQHYSYEMSRIFFEELGLPEPDVDLNVRTGSHSVQTAKVMVRVEKVIREYEPSIVVAQGDTNTVAAAALTAIKSTVPFAHVEAGLRSYDRTMPEETNRIVADSSSELLFAPTKLATENLAHEGIPSRKIYLTGNTVVDVVNEYREQARQKGAKLASELSLMSNEYLLLTLHRQENTDIHTNLYNILQGIMILSKNHKIVFPIHPRTKKEMARLGILAKLQKRPNLLLISPQGYLEFLGLLMNSSAVLTDSGGVQEEAFCLGVPTVTLRNNTERPETVLYGMNVLAGTEPRAIVRLTKVQVSKPVKRRTASKLLNPFGEGDAGRKIAAAIKDAVDGGIRVEASDNREDPYLVYFLTKPDVLETMSRRWVGKVEVITAYDSRGFPTLARGPRNSKKAKKLLVRAPLGVARASSEKRILDEKSR